MSTRDEARNTAQAAKGKAARAAGRAQEKKANLAQASEKPKNTAQKQRTG